MTDKITKELANFTSKERLLVKELLIQIRSDDRQGLVITKLKGHQDIFRIKKGRIRIIYRQNKEVFKVLVIERRSEKTYRDF